MTEPMTLEEAVRVLRDVGVLADAESPEAMESAPDCNEALVVVIAHAERTVAAALGEEG